MKQAIRLIRAAKQKVVLEATREVEGGASEVEEAVGDTSVTTKAVPSSASPVWDEEFEFEINPSQCYLYARLYDRKRDKRGELRGKSFLVGYTEIALEEVAMFCLANQAAFSTRAPLRASKNPAAQLVGELEVVLRHTPNNTGTAEETPASSGAARAPSSTSGSSGTSPTQRQSTSSLPTPPRLSASVRPRAMTYNSLLHSKAASVSSSMSSLDAVGTIDEGAEFHNCKEEAEVRTGVAACQSSPSRNLGVCRPALIAGTLCSLHAGWAGVVWRSRAPGPAPGAGVADHDCTGGWAANVVLCSVRSRRPSLAAPYVTGAQKATRRAALHRARSTWRLRRGQIWTGSSTRPKVSVTRRPPRAYPPTWTPQVRSRHPAWASKRACSRSSACPGCMPAVTPVLAARLTRPDLAQMNVGSFSTCACSSACRHCKTAMSS